MNDSNIADATEAEESVESLREGIEDLREALNENNLNRAEYAAETRRWCSRLDERLDGVEERLDAIEAKVSPDSMDYHRLTRTEKIQKVRETLYRQASENGRGAASMRYREIIALFDGEPSAPTAYDLMAATSERPGFDYRKVNGEKAVTVDVSRVKDADGFSES